MVSKQRIISALSTTPLADNSFDAFDEKQWKTCFNSQTLIGVRQMLVTEFIFAGFMLP